MQEVTLFLGLFFIILGIKLMRLKEEDQGTGKMEQADAKEEESR